MVYSLISDDNKTVATILTAESQETVDSTHPRWSDIVQHLIAGDEEAALELVNVGKFVEQRFTRLTDRIALRGNTLFFDGTAVSNVLAEHILEAAGDDSDRDLQALLNFMERLAANPNEHSRAQLYRYLEQHDFPITPEGKFIAYKGLRSNGTSIHAGPAIVDGEPVNGHVPNRVGSVVEIARDNVVHDPSVGCASGLHAGTWAYASGFAQGQIVKVEVDPSAVVSVPKDSGDQKLRVWQYKVLEVIDAPVTDRFVHDSSDEYWDDHYDELDDNYCDCCGDEVDYGNDFCNECSMLGCNL